MLDTNMGQEGKQMVSQKIFKNMGQDRSGPDVSQATTIELFFKNTSYFINWIYCLKYLHTNDMSD